ncbi:MAG: dihydrodipicolinate reductase, partial [Desulfobacteraceae bacterium]
MDPIKVMINGLPGNVTTVIARQVLADSRFRVLPYALTGPEIDYDQCHINETAFELIKPQERQA